MSREKKQEVTDTEIEEFLQNPYLLHNIGLLCRDVIQETDNILYTMLVVLEKQSIEVQGLTSAGKNTIANRAVELFPEGWIIDFTGVSDKAIRHLPDHIRGLYVRERKAVKTGGASEETTSEYDIKMAISEGKIKILQTVKNTESKTGFKTIIREVKVDSFIITTTAEAGPEEYENRFHFCRARDDPEQNRRVGRFQLGEAEKPTWTRARRNLGDFEIVREALRDVEKNAPPAVILYASELENVFDFEKPSVRRNIPKLLGVIEACARLHYKQRQVIENNGERNIIATPEDLYIVLDIASMSLTQTLGIMSKPVAETLEKCRELHRKDIAISTRSVATAFSWSGITVAGPTIRDRLYTLEKRGYIARQEERAEKNALIFDLTVNDETPISSLISLATDAKRSDLLKRFKTGLEAVCGSSLLDKDEPRSYIQPLTGLQVNTTYVIYDNVSSAKNTSSLQKDTLPQTGFKPNLGSVDEKKAFQSVGNQTSDTKHDLPDQHKFYKKAEKDGDVEKTAKSTVDPEPKKHSGPSEKGFRCPNHPEILLKTEADVRRHMKEIHGE